MALVVKNLPANAEDVRDVGSNPESQRYSRERNGNPLWYSCLECPVNKGEWWGYGPQWRKEWDTTEAT